MAIGSGFLPPVVVRLVAETGQFTADMAKASGEMGAFGEKATASAAKGSAAWDAVGKYAAAGAAIVGVASVKMASDFEAAMLRVQTNAGASTEEVKRMTKAILDLAPTVGESPKALADALFYIESSGMSGAKALDVLTNSAKLARIGNADLTEVTKALTSVMESGITGFKDAGDAAAIMNSIVGQGKMSMQDLSAAMGSGILSVAANFGISLQSVGAALDVLTVRGEPATQAATRLRAAIALMAAPSKQAAGILSELGLSTNEAAAAQNTMVKALVGAGVNFTRLADDMRQPNGIYVAIKDMQDQMTKAGLTSTQQAAVISRAFGGLRSATGIQTLNVDLDALATDFSRVGAGASQFGADWQATTKTTKQQMAELTTQIDVLLIQLGNFLIPRLTEGARWLSEHKRLATDLAEVVGGVLVAAMARYIAMQAIAFAGSVLNMVSSVVTGVQKLAVAYEVAASAEGGFAAGMLGTLGPAALLSGALLGIARAVDGSVPALKSLDEKTVSFESHIPLVGHALASLDEKVLGISQSHKKAATATAEHSAAVDKLSESMHGLLSGTMDVMSATSNYTIGVDTLRQAVEAQAGSTDSNTVKQAQLRQELASLVGSLAASTDALAKHGDITNTAAGRADYMQTQLRQLEDQFPGLRDEIEHYIADLNSIPSNVDTSVNQHFNNYYTDTYITRRQSEGYYGPGYATGGIIGQALAAGGQITAAAAGFMTTGPTLVGEGNPAWPEFVVATDPQYHARNVDLWMKAGKRLNMFAGTGAAGSSGGSVSPVGGVTITGPITVVVQGASGAEAARDFQAELLRYQRSNGTTGIKT